MLDVRSYYRKHKPNDGRFTRHSPWLSTVRWSNRVNASKKKTNPKPRAKKRKNQWNPKTGVQSTVDSQVQRHMNALRNAIRVGDTCVTKDIDIISWLGGENDTENWAEVAVKFPQHPLENYNCEWICRYMRTLVTINPHFALISIQHCLLPLINRKPYLNPSHQTWCSTQSRNSHLPLQS